MDLQMEFFNKEYKESVKDAAGQLTEATIARHSQMVGVGKVIRNVYYHQVASLERSMIQTSSRPSRENDISLFVELMLEEQIFMTVPGRKFKSFPDTSMVLFRKNPVNYFWQSLDTSSEGVVERSRNHESDADLNC
uniref:Uncharacterized protein LOC111121699 n=1 Tax=Crassostrea virginica TaxID=6565 RepID=A0A8B8CSS0_CRAVI|nr:uncharacterized protein LOC111121699 [Crassostrea virginica]